jgi:integrase
MSVFKRGNIWWYEFVFGGQRVRESTGSRSRTLAVKAERQRRSEFEHSANRIQIRERPVLFSVAAPAWMETNQARWSASNINIQTHNLKHLHAAFGQRLLVEITADHIGKYQTARQREGASNRTINMEVATLRMLLKWRKVWTTIADDVRMLPERKTVGKALSKEEHARLLAACRNSAQPSLYTAVVVFCNTGLRNAELRRARWHQVDFLKSEFQVGKAKTVGSEGRIIPLNRAALAALQEWRARWQNAKPEHYIFPSEKLMYKGAGSPDARTMTAYGVDPEKALGSWKRAWGTAKREAAVECRLHDCRHFFITQLAETQTSDATIQALSGHLSRKMLEHYSHVRNDAKRQAVELLDRIDGHTVQ